MSDTPRTDELDNAIKTNPPSSAPTPYRASEYESIVRLARQLERELARFTAVMPPYPIWINDGVLGKEEYDTLRHTCAALKVERDDLVTTLQSISAASGYGIGSDAMSDIARNALKETK